MAYAGPTPLGTRTHQETEADNSPTGFSHTLAAGSNRIVLGIVHYEDAGTGNTPQVSTMTYGGQTMTSLVAQRDEGSNSLGCEIWYILETNLPSDGANTLAWSLSGGGGSSIDRAICHVWAIQDAEQVAPTVAVQQNQSGSPYSSTPSTNADHTYCFETAAQYSTTAFGLTGDFVEQYDVSFGSVGARSFIADYQDEFAGTVTASGTKSSGTMSHIIVFVESPDSITIPSVNVNITAA